MKIKTRKKKKKLTPLEWQMKTFGRELRKPIKGRPKEITKEEGKGFFLYDFAKNEAMRIKGKFDIRFYFDEETYLEFTPNKNRYMIVRSKEVKGGLVQMLVRPYGISWLEIRPFRANELDKDGETIW